MRDYRPSDTIRIPFVTNAADGSALAPTATAAKLYVDGSLTELTAGLTVTVSYDGIVGLNMLVIDGATAGLVAGKTYHARMDATVAGLSCTSWIGQFSVLAQGGDIVSRGVLAAGGAGTFTLQAGQIDRVKVGDAIRLLPGGTGYGYRPILTYNIGTGAGTVSGFDVNPVAGDPYEVVSLPNPEVLAATDFADGFLTAAKILDNALTEAKFATDALSARVLKADAVTEVQAGLATAAALATAQTDVTAIKGAVDTEVAAILADTTNLKTRVPAALVGGKMDAALDATGLADNAITANKIAGGALTASKFSPNAIDASALAADAVAEIQANLATAAALSAAQADLDDLQTRIPAALVGGRISASVDSTGLADGAITAAKLAAAAITAAKFATDAVDANALKADAVTKIQVGLATAATQATIASYIDTEITNIQSRLPAALVGGKMDATAVLSLAPADVTAVTDAIFGYLIESGLDFRAAMRLLTSLLLGLTTGVETATPVFTSADVAGGVVVGSKPRITATREVDGDRAALAVDLS